jgi:serine/threonine protein phosphatase PrpC
MNSDREFAGETNTESPAILDTWEPLDVDLGAATDQGHVRENNEDSYLVIRFGRSLENLSTNLEPHLLDPNYTVTGYGMLVADGMGGMAAGEVASRLALTKLIELIVDTSDWTLSLKRDADVRTVMQRMTQRFHQIDDALRAAAENTGTLRGMGTTLTVAGILENSLIIGHVGDSRAYLLRGNNLRQLTVDHTLAQALIDAGVANQNDPATRSMRHVLTAAIGSLSESAVPQVQRFRLSPGDQLMLCTDGLTEMVEEETISKVLHEATSAQVACQSLIDLALSAGGVDNVTVLVARLKTSSRDIGLAA